VIRVCVAGATGWTYVAGTLLAICEATRRVGVTRGLDTLLFHASGDRPQS
jgi:hypothetical protein